MPQIQKQNQPVTQITVVESEPGKQEEALSLMVERAHFMARQPGFVSISLHRSRDGRRIVNYVQWRNRELLQSAHHSPEFRAEWRHFDDLTREIEPQLYRYPAVDPRAFRPRNGRIERHVSFPVQTDRAEGGFAQLLD